MIDRARYFFAHNRTHGAADKIKIHAGYGDWAAADCTAAYRHCIKEAGIFLRIFYTCGVGFLICKAEVIFRTDVFKMRLPLAAVKQNREILFGIDSIVKAAVWANVCIQLHLLRGRRRLALGAFMPEPIRRLFLLPRTRCNARLYSPKPGGCHAAKIWVIGYGS